MVVQNLLENKLFVKVEKCEFHTHSISFLGHMVEKGHSRAYPAKVQAVLNWPTPTSQSTFQCFLGLPNFTAGSCTISVKLLYFSLLWFLPRCSSCGTVLPIMPSPLLRTSLPLYRYSFSLTLLNSLCCARFRYRSLGHSLKIQGR